MNIFGHVRQGVFYHIRHGWPMRESFSGMNADHQLDIGLVCEILNRFLDPICHAAREEVPSQGQAVAKHIGCEQHNRTFLIQPQLLAKLFAALGFHILPFADRLPEGTSAHSGRFKLLDQGALAFG
jgi:hypothetical protein